MTWPEVDAALKGGVDTVIVPCGAVEQHGPHLPLFMDAEHGTWLGREVASRMTHTLVAPTIRVGCSQHHMAFPGSLTLETETFVAVCRDYCRSLAHHGFTRICMLPTHGGNFRPLDEALAGLNEAVGPDCVVHAYTDLMSLMDIWKEAVASAGGPAGNVGGHADVAESSLMLVMHPDLVRVDLATAGYFPDPTAESYARIIRDGLRTVTPTGVLGDARGMSREAGVACLNALAAAVAAHFESCRGD
jgi:creatinine amidohydrolase